MDRQIKFRVWNGMEMIYDVTVGKFGTFFVHPENNGLDPKDSACITPFTTKYPDDIPLMQYTGLKDKNGKEIYEGDVIKTMNAESATVEFSNGGFKYQYDKEGKRPLFDPIAKHSEVIGNIYDNPELLNQ